MYRNIRCPSCRSWSNISLPPPPFSCLPTLDLSLLVAAALLSVTWASPCTQVCFGSCSLTAQASLVLMPFFEPFAQLNLDACRAVCVATCHCVDTCQGICATALATCRDVPDNGFFKFFECQFGFSTCNVIYGTQCTLSTSAGVFDRTLKALLPPPEDERDWDMTRTH